MSRLGRAAGAWAWRCGCAERVLPGASARRGLSLVHWPRLTACGAGSSSPEVRPEDAASPRRPGDALRAALVAVAREFNAGRFYESHEMLEDVLDLVPDTDWELFVGLIQIAAGYRKIQQRIATGALRMLEIGLAKLAPLAADAGGLDVEELRGRARRELEALCAGQCDPASLERDPPRLRPLPRVRRS